MSSNEIVLYQPEGEVAGINVMVGDDTVWLNRQQMAKLFGRDVKTIGKHINNALAEELAEFSTVAKFATVETEGGRKVTRQIEHYNLDMILSVGYRVKSPEGIHFRQWATGVLREYLLRGYAINPRIERLEQRMGNAEDKIDFFVRTALPPVEGIFYEGQIFDAYEFAAKLVKSARQRIALVDNYIDESVLLLLAKRRKGVTATMYCGKVGKALLADVAKHNEQYPPIEVTQTSGIHDRFLIIDDEVYHLGASVKDLGKKLFAFSRMNIPPADILDKCKTM